MTSNGDRPGEDNAEATDKLMMTTDSDHTPPGYGSAADLYRRAGWLGVLPVPSGCKEKAPTGFTGQHGRWPTYDQIRRWSWMNPMWNVALRLPDDVIGIDLDTYKAEAITTITKALGHCGRLPETWRSSSRDDVLSGIYLYRVPEGIHWKSELGPGVETIRFGHRYMLVWPSVHPKGRRYEWHDRDGIPKPGDLPELPEAWVRELTHAGGRRDTKRYPAGVPTFDVGEAMTAGVPMFVVGRRLARALADIDGPDRHKHTCGHVLALLGLGQRGQPGVGAALERLRDKFVTVVGPEREGGWRDAADEFDRMVSGAGRRLAVTR